MKIYITVRVRCAFCGDIVRSIFLHLSGDALRDRVKRAKLVRNPTTLHESHELLWLTMPGSKSYLQQLPSIGKIL